MNEKIPNIMPIINQDISYKSAKVTEDYLMDRLKDLDDAYKAIKDNRLKDYEASLPKALELEKIIYDAPTNDELKEKAEKKLSAEFINGKNEIIKDIEETKSILDKNKANLSKAQKESLDNLDKVFESVNENIKNSTLKRGLGRSSIAINKLTEAELSKAEQAGLIESSTKEAVLEIESKINELEKEKQDSLKAFDLEYAIKVQDELDKLIKEREKKIADVTSFNNKVEKEQTDYESKRADKIEEMREQIKQSDINDDKYYKEQGYMPGMRDEYEERYQMAFDFYSKLPVSTAKRVLNENAELEQYLGSKYYNKLRTLIVMRK